MAEKLTLETADCHPQPWRHLAKTGGQKFVVTAAVTEKREKSLRRAAKKATARTSIQMEALPGKSYLLRVTEESVVDRVGKFVDFVYGLFS